MHDEREQAELIKRQRDANKAYSVSNELGDETESQVDSVFFAGTGKPSDYPPLVMKRNPQVLTDPNEPPPISPSDRVWGQGFWVGCICGVVMLLSVCGMAWLAVKGIDAGFWWMGQFLGAR
jgi:hypothetical protein